MVLRKGYIAGADPGFQVRGGALKKIAPSRGRRENFGGISCEKSRFYAKKIIFFPILAGVGGSGAPPTWIRPCDFPQDFFTSVAQRVPLVEQEPLTLGAHELIPVFLWDMCCSIWFLSV